MALKATVCKAQISIADMDRAYYNDHSLTLARHPSETDERMLVRLMAFAMHADEALAFGKGISADDEPALWRKDLTGNIELWIDVGLPDEKWLRKSCGRAREVVCYLYGGRAADLWWTQNRDALAHLRNLSVVNLRYASAQALTRIATRNMTLQFTLQDGQLWITDGSESVEVALDVLQKKEEM